MPGNYRWTAEEENILLRLSNSGGTYDDATARLSLRTKTAVLSKCGELGITLKGARRQKRVLALPPPDGSNDPDLDFAVDAAKLLLEAKGVEVNAVTEALMRDAIKNGVKLCQTVQSLIAPASTT